MKVLDSIKVTELVSLSCGKNEDHWLALNKPVFKTLDGFFGVNYFSGLEVFRGSDVITFNFSITKPDPEVHGASRRLQFPDEDTRFKTVMAGISDGLWEKSGLPQGKFNPVYLDCTLFYSSSKNGEYSLGINLPEAEEAICKAIAKYSPKTPAKGPHPMVKLKKLQDQMNELLEMERQKGTPHEVIIHDGSVRILL